MKSKLIVKALIKNLTENNSYEITITNLNDYDNELDRFFRFCNDDKFEIEVIGCNRKDLEINSSNLLDKLQQIEYGELAL